MEQVETDAIVIPHYEKNEDHSIKCQMVEKFEKLEPTEFWMTTIQLSGSGTPTKQKKKVNAKQTIHMKPFTVKKDKLTMLGETLLKASYLKCLLDVDISKNQSVAIPRQKQKKRRLDPDVATIREKILLLKKEAIMLLNENRYPTANRVFINIYKASLKNDTKTALVLKRYRNETTFGYLNVDTCCKAIMEEEQDEDIEEEDGSPDNVKPSFNTVKIDFKDIGNVKNIYCDTELPEEIMELYDERSANIIVSTPSDESIQRTSCFGTRHFALSILNPSAVGKSGRAHPCLIIGKNIIPKSDRSKIPNTICSISTLFNGSVNLKFCHVQLSLPTTFKTDKIVQLLTFKTNKYLKTT